MLVKKIMLILLFIFLLPSLSLAENIIFSSYISENWEIWMINPDGTNLIQLTHSLQEKRLPAWSPNRKKITYATNEGEVWVMDIEGSPEIVSFLPPNCAQPTFSPDGEKVAFVSYSFAGGIEASDLWIADLKQNKAWKLMEQEGIQSYPAWSPDGSIIAYTTGYVVGKDRVVEQLWLVNSDGTNPKSLVSDNFCNIQGAWSPDGKRIAFASNGGGNVDVWVVDKSGGNIQQLTHHKAYDADPSWSSDGAHICFVSTRSGKLDIWIMDSDGKNQKPLTGLTDASAESKEPCW